MLFPDNIGENLSLNETSLSNGEQLYTILTNKSAKGKKRCLIAMIKGKTGETVISIINKIPKNKRRKVKEIRIKHRWNAINEATNGKENAKLNNTTFTPFRFDNGDTKKQLLARSRYLLFKSPDKRSQSQNQRAKILFAQYPDIKKDFELTNKLRLIYSKTKDEGIAFTKLARYCVKIQI